MFDSIRLLGIDYKKIVATSGLICLEVFFAGAPFGVLYMVLTAIFANPIPVERLYTYLGLLILSFVLQAIFAVKGHISASLFSFNTGGKLRLRLGDCLRRLPLGFSRGRSTGALVDTFLFDVSLIETTISHLYSKLVASVVLPVFIVAILFFIDWRLACVIILTVPVALIFILSFQRRLDNRTLALADSRRAFSDTLLEFLQGIATFKAYNILGSQAERLSNNLKSFCRQNIAFENITAPMVFGYSLILDLGFPLMLAASYVLMRENTLSVSVLMLFTVVCLRFYEPLHSISLYYAMLRQARGAVTHISDILQRPEMTGNLTPSLSGDVEIAFENVRYAYGSTVVLQDVSFVMRPQSMTALVGPSGAGKTTIAQLLSRFWDPQSGTITMNGIPLTEILPEHIASHISTVMQDVTLFNDTIYNNIRVGNPQASEQQVLAAAESARCLDFISQLPQGINTDIGENGIRLSGGERQRVSIARALLKDSPIVVLDEATASLDYDNEFQIQMAFEPLVRKKTLLVIAHRLSTIVHADQILFVEQGRIVQQGRFDDLVGTPGRFRDFWDCQQRVGKWKLHTA